MDLIDKIYLDQLANQYLLTYEWLCVQNSH